MSDNSALKDNIDRALVEHMGRAIRSVYPAFPVDDFSKRIASTLDTLELKERVAWIADTLHEFLPDDFPEAIQILQATFHPEGEEADGLYIEDWGLWAVAHFVGFYGLDYLEESLAAMYEITKRHSSEFPIRFFLERYPDQVLVRLHEWAYDENEHVRRLVSEGTRPRLPWAGQLQQFINDPSPTIELLEILKDDSSLYVRKSVANHLNDITKDHPQLVIDLLTRWSMNASEGTMWIIKHALRSLLKQGNPEALKLLGYGEPLVQLANLSVTPSTIHMDETLKFLCTVQNESSQSQSLMIDYIIHFMKANGETRPKVFKLSKRKLNAGEAIEITKQHTIRPISTRRYYPGEHRLEIQINGVVMGSTNFMLEM